MNIWLAYVNYPITTASYLKRALLQTGNNIRTVGPRLPEEAIEAWDLQNMRLPLSSQDIDTSPAPDMAALLSDTPVAERPDLYLWVESVNGYNPLNVKALNCPTACYLIDTHYHLATALEAARQFDYVFIAQLVDLEAFRAVHPHVYWLPLACDPEIHGRQEVDKFCDVGFVGSMNRRREAMLEHLAEHFQVHQERSFWRDMARTFSGSRIVLNDASLDDLNMRFFEALASGSLLLSNPTKGSGQDILFHDGEDYACHNDENLIEVVQHYLTHDDLREQIARLGRQRVLSAHTYSHRVDDMLNVLLRGKKDTFSPEELRERSEIVFNRSGILHSPKISKQKKPPAPSLQIRAIITTRYSNCWPTWQMVHEWEDILANLLGVSLKPLGERCLVSDPDYGEDSCDLMFLQLAGELRHYEGNRRLIPIVMDLWRNDFADFKQRAKSFPLIFATNLQAFRELKHSIPNLRYLPFCLADQYLDWELPVKDIDVIHYGRKNPLLDKFMNRFLEHYPATRYVTTEVSDDGQKVFIHSNFDGVLAESNSRLTFMNILARSKVSLVSTVGMDGSRDTGGIDPVSPRFFESLAAGCRLLGRIPDNEEFNETGMYKFCQHVNNYEDFEAILLKVLADPVDPRQDYLPFLQQKLASSMVPQLLFGLDMPFETDFSDKDFLYQQEDLMQSTKPQTDLAYRLDVLKMLKGKLSPQLGRDNYNALSDVIGFYAEFWGLNLFDSFTDIIAAHDTFSDALHFQSCELFCRGELQAACMVARRAMELAPDNESAALQYAELLRCTGKLDAARAITLETMKKSTQGSGFSGGQALLDMCDIAEQLPLDMDHYQLLHKAQKVLRPRRYIEIGVYTGKSLSLSRAGTSVIGVDPATAIPEQQFYHSPEAIPNLFKLTSNDFFKQGLMEKVWGEAPFDMAFIDGMHLFEQALLDFINLECRSASNSVIFIHDCLPVSTVCAERERRSMVWTGDVWKIIPCLKAVRPDLEIITLPVRPSGLAIVRNLDRNSRVLASQIDAIVEHFMTAELPENMNDRFKMLNVTSDEPQTVLDNILALQGAWQKES